MRLLQMNLCNSGIAGCFSGRSVAEAAAVIRTGTPDVVTLNEVCRDDVAELERALAEAAGTTTSSRFQPARDRRTGRPYFCRDGGEFGIGVVSRTRSRTASSGIHPSQDPRDPEERSWLCLDTGAGDPVTVCTSHLAYTDRAIALAQCRYLFDVVIAGLRARDGAGPVVVGADLNLGPDLRSCVSGNAVTGSDDGRQHVVTTSGLAATGSRSIDLRGSTDHPALLVTLAPG